MRAVPPERLLLIRLTAMGDVLLATPLLRALRVAYPGASIDWLAHEAFVPLLQSNPHLTQAIALPRGRRELVDRLRARRYDLVIDLQNKLETFRLRRSLGARQILVLRKRGPWQALLSLLGRDPPQATIHAVDLGLSIAARLGIPGAGRELDLVVSEQGRLEAASLLAQRGEAAIWGLAPATRWSTKRWPLDRWVEVAAQAARAGARVVLLGGQGDASTLDDLAGRLGPELIGDTRDLSTGGLAAVVEACSQVVSNDSGPAHLAAALGRPVTVLFGPTSPTRWAPLGRDVRVLYRGLPCSPCSNHGSARCPVGTHACLAEIHAEEVVRAIQREHRG
ncbi:MAG: glycosyltransferase family 9 protein [Deltaproteobacteria bacterium]